MNENVIIDSSFDSRVWSPKLISLDYNQNKTIHIRLWSDEDINDIDVTQFRLFKITNVLSNEIVSRFDYNDDRPLWVDIPMCELDTAIGLHEYSIELINTITGDSVYRYFSYTIQRVDLKPSYIYVDKTGREDKTISEAGSNYEGQAISNETIDIVMGG